MPGLSTPESIATLDQRFPTTGGADYIAYSINGTTEWAGMARTAIGATGWAAATNADPSVKANASALTSANATASTGGNVTIYYAVMSASTGGTQRTDWTALTDTADAARTFNLAIGDQITHAVGAIRVTLT